MRIYDLGNVMSALPTRNPAAQSANVLGQGQSHTNLPPSLQRGLGRICYEITAQHRLTRTGRHVVFHDPAHVLRLLHLAQQGPLAKESPLEAVRPKQFWRATALALVSRESSARPGLGCRGRPCGLAQIAPKVLRSTIREARRGVWPACTIRRDPVFRSLERMYARFGRSAERMLQNPEGNILALYARMKILTNWLKKLGCDFTPDGWQAALVLLHHEGVSRGLAKLFRRAMARKKALLTKSSQTSQRSVGRGSAAPKGGSAISKQGRQAHVKLDVKDVLGIAQQTSGKAAAFVRAVVWDTMRLRAHVP